MSEPVEDGFYDAERASMVEQQLRGLGIADERVLAAMAKVPRHLFVPPYLAALAYQDRALPIGFDQTISQPYMVALMLEALELDGSERVLEVGAGSGYQAAVLGLLAREVYGVEIVPGLTDSARRIIERLGYDNVQVVLANGSLGFPKAAPYDAIVVAAGAPEVPEELVSQLGEGGRLVIPVGERWAQTLLRIRKTGGRTRTERLTPCVFVPLVGAEGWAHESIPTDRYPSFDEKTALIVVDVQNDFADPRGNLHVQGGEDVVAEVNALTEAARRAGGLVVYTQDWHPAKTPHFRDQGGAWPAHCVQGTWGAEFVAGLHVQGPVVQKGTGSEDGYSGFSVRDETTGARTRTHLDSLLKEHGIERIVVVGLAQDVCVKETALDGRRLGYATTVVASATRPVDARAGERALDDLAAAGVEVA